MSPTEYVLTAENPFTLFAFVPGYPAYPLCPFKEVFSVDDKSLKVNFAPGSPTAPFNEVFSEEDKSLKVNFAPVAPFNEVFSVKLYLTGLLLVVMLFLYLLLVLPLVLHKKVNF